MVCTGCCATLDHIVTYLFKKVTNKGNTAVLEKALEKMTFLFQAKSLEGPISHRPRMILWWLLSR